MDEDPFLLARDLIFRIIPEKDYSEVVENLVDCIDLDIFAVNEDGIVTIWNESIARKVLPREQALGRSLLEVFPHLGTDDPFDLARLLFEDVLARGNTIRKERAAWLPAQSGRLFDLSLHPLLNRFREIIGAVAISRDVTEKKRIEELLLRHTKTETTAHLGGTLAHELRNPLNAISLNLQLLKESPNLAPDQQQSLTAIQEEITRLNQLIRNFTTFSRSEQLSLVRDAVDPVLTRVVQLFTNDARQRGIRLQAYPRAQEPVSHDPAKLEQVLINLTKNALEATPAGGRVSLKSFCHPNFILLQVVDTGPGIPPPERDRLFDVFYTTKEGGSGLGLPIANRLVELHGGRLLAENNVGPGATLSVYLPREVPASPSGASPSPSPDPAR